MEAATTYQKHNSFHDLHVAEGKTNPVEQSARGRKSLQTIRVKRSRRDMFWIKSWEIYRAQIEINKFCITPFVADEMRLIEDKDIPRYLFHRYRYEIYPQLQN